MYYLCAKQCSKSFYVTSKQLSEVSAIIITPDRGTER